MSEDYYALLGVRPTASAAEIARAYRFLARAYHPDLRHRADLVARRGAEERLKAINRAYRVVGDRERRAAYDQRRLRRMLPAGEPPPPAPRAAVVRSTGPPHHTAARTTHRAGGGPIDIEWATVPRAARPASASFLRYDRH